MQSLLFVMAIMGCGEGDSACREVRIDQQRFQSVAACQAATASALIRHGDLDFPTVVARCRPANARPQLLRGSEVLLPAPNPARALPRFAARSARR
ncbi:MAG TPA: hypothetical protein VGO55_17935 [Allosphingosinicella sp.]|jgi:hypothetical protein|nr:hypothetical protein [Allosphingosinicella sp.]